MDPVIGAVPSVVPPGILLDVVPPAGFVGGTVVGGTVVGGTVVGGTVGGGEVTPGPATSHLLVHPSNR